MLATCRCRSSPPGQTCVMGVSKKKKERKGEINQKKKTTKVTKKKKGRNDPGIIKN